MVKKWVVSDECLDLIKKHCPFFDNPVLLNPTETDDARKEYLVGYNFTKVSIGQHSSTETYTLTKAKRLVKSMLNAQLAALRPRFNKEILEKIEQNHIDAMASFIQSNWIILPTHGSAVSEFVKSPVFKGIKQDKFDKAADNIMNARIVLPSSYPTEVKNEYNTSEINKRRRDESKLFSTTNPYIKKINLPDSNVFMVAKKITNKKEREQFVKDFFSL